MLRPRSVIWRMSFIGSSSGPSGGVAPEQGSVEIDEVGLHIEQATRVTCRVLDHPLANERRDPDETRSRAKLEHVPCGVRRSDLLLQRSGCAEFGGEVGEKIEVH